MSTLTYLSQSFFSLRGRSILITGGCGLLGQKHVEAVALAGGIPIILDKNLSASSSISRSIANKTSITPLFLECDITDEESIATSIKQIQESDLPPLRGLINNAAFNPDINPTALQSSYSHLENFSLSQWHREISVGLTGAFLCIKHFGPLLVHDGLMSSILNISSDLGLIAPNQSIYKTMPDQPFEEPPVKAVTYPVIKSGLIGLTRYVATYWPQHIRANCLCPGGIYTGQPNDFVSALSSLIPMKRMANVDEYRGAVIFALSDASSYMNGSIISIDGGRTCW